LNKKNDVDSSKHEDEKLPSEDSSEPNEESTKPNEDTTKPNENQNVNQEINSDNNQIDSIKPTDKNDNYIEFDQSMVTEISSLKINKFDTIQIISTTVGITFLIIFIIFFKIYQQKLRKKSSK